MQTFKRILISVLSFIVTLILLSAVIIEPNIDSEISYSFDSKLRKELAGKIDYAVIGASQGLLAFDPRVLDSELGCYSYNLSNIMMTMYSRTYILKKELERNPIKTVVIDISFDALSRNQNKECGDGDSITVARLDSLPERLSFTLRYTSVDNWLNIYSRELMSGIMYWKNKISGTLPGKGIDYSLKGFNYKGSVDVTISENSIVELYNSKSTISSFRNDSIKQLDELIKLCKDNNCRVIIASIPVSDSLIWKSNDLDVFYDWVSDYCTRNDCEFYDFNLLKNRNELFSDDISFYDEGHLSESGAKAFTKAFADVTKQADEGYDVSALFYESYEEMKDFSPYMQYYKEHCES